MQKMMVIVDMMGEAPGHLEAPDLIKAVFPLFQIAVKGIEISRNIEGILDFDAFFECH